MEETFIDSEFELDNETITSFISKPKKWEMPFFDNFHLVPTDRKPTFAGFYRNLGARKNHNFAGGWVLRFSDGYYNMVLCIRKAGQLPKDKGGRLQLRCQVRICRAKALVKCIDDEIPVIEKLFHFFMQIEELLVKIIENLN